MKFLSKYFSKNSHRDPVCGMAAGVNISAAHGADTFFFCSESCRDEFLSNPQKYAK